MLRFLLLLLTAGLLSLTAGGQTNKKIKSLQREQKSLKKDIDDGEKLLRTTKKDINSQLSNLQVISSQIEAQQKKTDGIHAELTELATDIAGLEKQLRLLENDLEECKRKYRHAMTYMYKNRMQFSKWQFILSAKNFRQMYRRLRYVTEFSKYQIARGRIIRQKEEEVKAKRAMLKEKKTEKNRLFEEGKSAQRKLEGQQQERQQAVDNLNRKQKELQQSLAKRRKEYANLNARIDRLIQEEIAAAERRRKAEAERKRKEELARQKKEREQKEREAARRREEARRKTAGKAGSPKQATAKNAPKGNAAKGSAKKNETPTPKFRAADNADYALNNSFAANRGRLPVPITGSYAITAHYGQYNVPGLHGVQLDNKGVNLTGRAGAQAQAVFKGEVTAIFTYGGMYNIIVRHGSYMSVYCNLSSAAVRRGQQVSARQVLGTVATDPSGNCTLHFQLRRETEKLNPEAWLSR